METNAEDIPHLSVEERSSWKNCGDIHRRENLEDFVDGLVRTEVFPYPDGQRDIVPSVQVPVEQVRLKPGAYLKLTTWVTEGVWFPGRDGEWEYGDETITLTPEFGPGAFEITYNIRDDSEAPEPKPRGRPRGPNKPGRLHECDEDGYPSALKPGDLGKPSDQSLRMSLWSRLEWVQEKMEYVNWLRSQVAREGTNEVDLKAMWWHEDYDDSAADLEEEADPYDLDDVTSNGSSRSRTFDVDEASDSDDDKPVFKEFKGDGGYTFDEHDVEFPDTTKLSTLDISTLKALFEIKQLKELQSGSQGEGSKKRPIVITDEDLSSKRPRIDHIDSIILNYTVVASKLPTTETDGDRIKAFRQAAGKLHLAARILELDYNLNNNVKQPESPEL